MNLFKIIPIFIGFVFVTIICWWIFVGVVVYRGSNEIAENGLGSIVHDIWCGKKTNCKVPGVEE